MFFLFRFTFKSDTDFNEIKKVCELYKDNITILYYIPYDNLKTYEIILEINDIEKSTVSVMEQMRKFNSEIKKIVKPHNWNDRIVNYISNFEYELILDLIENDTDEDLNRVVIFNKEENEEENVLQVLNKEEKDTKPSSCLSLRWQLDSECECDDYFGIKVN